MSRKFIKQFKRFLKEHGVYVAFLKNYNSYCIKKESTVSPANFLKYSTACGALSTAFAWIETPEGYEFWFKLSNRWIVSVSLEDYDSVIEYYKET